MRPTGRTQRMLEEAAAYPGPVTIVAHSQAAAADLQRRMCELLDDRVVRNRTHLGTIERCDGSRMVFVTPNATMLRGRASRIFIDHYVLETCRDPEFWAVARHINTRAAESAA